MNTAAPAPSSAAMTQYVEGVAPTTRATPTAVSLVAATQADPNLIMARSRLADLYVQEKDYPAAIEQYELVKLDPYAADNHYRSASPTTSCRSTAGGAGVREGGGSSPRTTGRAT